MIKRFAFILLLLLSLFGVSQEKAISVSTEADIVGGKSALEQVLQTQLTLPKLLLTKDFSKQVTVYFELDSLNRAYKVTFSEPLNNLLRQEIKRVLMFLKFNRKTSISETPYEYYLTLSLSTEKYYKYIKQKSKPFVKNDKATDSSFVVYAKADRSPAYYKGGDDGLAEFVMNEIQYPDIAKEKSIQGTVVLEFIVEANGFITNIENKQNVAGGCTEEAVRVIQQTKWQPAVLNNKYVRYRMNYPITFNLQNSFKDNTTPRQGSNGF